MAHANWLRNRLPSSRIKGQLPILKWSPETIVGFTGVPIFGQKGFAFIYQSKSVAKKELLPRSELACFVGMESNTRFIRAYLPSSKSVKVIRRADFRLNKEDRLPGISTLIDGLSRQASIEVDEDEEKERTTPKLIL